MNSFFSNQPAKSSVPVNAVGKYVVGTILSGIVEETGPLPSKELLFLPHQLRLRSTPLRGEADECGHLEAVRDGIRNTVSLVID